LTSFQLTTVDTDSYDTLSFKNIFTMLFILLWILLSVANCDGLDNNTSAPVASNLRPGHLLEQISGLPIDFGNAEIFNLTSRDLSSKTTEAPEKHPDNDVDKPTPAPSPAPSESSHPTMAPTVSAAPTHPPTDPPTAQPTSSPTAPPPTPAPTKTARVSPLSGLIDRTGGNPKASLAGMFVFPIVAVAVAFWVMNQNNRAVTVKELKEQMLDKDPNNNFNTPDVHLSPSLSMGGVEMINTSRFGSSQTIVEIPSVDALSTEYTVMQGVDV
jgi:hypothetical protein